MIIYSYGLCTDWSGMLWASLRENPAPPHDCILPSFLFPLSCFSSHLIHIPPTHVAHTLSFLKQHSDFVICLLGHIFLHWIGPDSSICGQTPTSTQPLQTDPPLLIPGHFMFHSSGSPWSMKPDFSLPFPLFMHFFPLRQSFSTIVTLPSQRLNSGI